MEGITIFRVADWFLSIESMTHKKLQKLCYYAQSWHLALLNKRLFNDKFQAWVHGPVNNDLYKKYSSYGWNLIPQKNKKIEFPEETLQVLESVVATYIKYTAGELEYLTHQEVPWKEARRGLGEWEASKNIIDEEIMKNYYKSLYTGD